MSGSNRRQSREIALQVLFQLEYMPQHPVQKAIEYFRSTITAEAATWAYAEEILNGVQTNRSPIDSEIQKHTAHWKLDRLALVDLNILRVATFELRFAKDPAPPAAVINEAIEIAKKYGSSDSGKFVNGILDQIRKSG